MARLLQYKIVSFIWSTANDCLWEVYAQGDYQDVILRNLKKVMAELLKLEQETEGLLKKLGSFREMN